MEVITVNTEEQRLQCLSHKQQLENLPTFSLRLKYWLENINSFPDPDKIIYVLGETVLAELHLKPITDEDRGELNRVWMEDQAKGLAERKVEVFESGSENKLAFHVKSLLALKHDLEQRLSVATRKKDLVVRELEYVTASIDAICKPINEFHKPYFLAEVKDLRSSLELNISYDFTFKNERFPDHKAACLARVWDIVHYESFLKDEIYLMQNRPVGPSTREKRITEGSIPTRYNSIVSENDIDKQIKTVHIVEKILLPLSGSNLQKEKIMSKENFDRLINYTNHLALNDICPDVKETFKQTGISNEHIRYTFYRLHKELHGTKKIHKAFIDFIHTVFLQFKGTAPSTTKSKFSHKPKSYDKDFAGYIGDES